MTKETVGKISSELIVKAVDNTHSAEEQMREQLSDYDKFISFTVNEGKVRYLTDFYVVVITKKERLMPNVLRNYFTTRVSCPTPDYDQTLYKYDRDNDSIEFMWVIPSKDTCQHLRDHAIEVDKSERALLNFVLGFYDGTLLELAKKLNGDKPDMPLSVLTAVKDGQIIVKK